MASSRAIEAAKAFVRIVADDSPLLKSLSGLVGRMKGTALGAGKAFAGGLGSSAKSALGGIAGAAGSVAGTLGKIGTIAAGIELVPMVKAATAAMLDFSDVKDFLPPEQKAVAEQFGEAISNLSATARAAAISFGLALAPTLTTVVNAAAAAIPIVANVAMALGQLLVQAALSAWEALQELAGLFPDLLSAAKDFFGTMGALLSAGELDAAAAFLWASLRSAWATGIAALTKEWLIWQEAFLSVFNDALAAAMKAWYRFQNTLSGLVVEVMGYFDSSINAQDVQSELDSMLQAQLKNVDREAEVNRKARESAFDTNITQANADMEAARAEWAAAVTQAKQVAERTANEPSAAGIADNKFTELLNSLKAGVIASRIDQAVSAPTSQDVRSVGGVGQLTSFINQTGEISRQQLRFLRQIAEHTSGLVDLGVNETVNI